VKLTALSKMMTYSRTLMEDDERSGQPQLQVMNFLIAQATDIIPANYQLTTEEAAEKTDRNIH
jgi:hypothetical protein